jgi:diguanylate cyclase (GGDEF)-like protein
VLHAYAHEIMSQFRSYDLVARYGDDEFAVLLPNTQKEGATRAIDKAQKRAAGTYIQVEGHNVPLPSFSSVLTLYSHGEPPETLLQRADEALAHAKQRGAAQSVLALPSG